MALLFTGIAIWSVWPAPRYPYSTLPTGWRKPASVPMLNAWTIWWNADRLARGLADYWDAPIFHPHTGTFAFSEPQPATWSVAPIVWATGTPMPAYHAYLLGTLVLNGVFAVRLLRTLRVRWAAALAGGVAMLLLPLAHQNYEALQLMSLWGTLWTLDALIRHYRRPSWGRGVVLGLAFSSVFLTCIHHGLFLTLLLSLSAWWGIPRKHWKPWLAGMAVAGATAAVVLMPLLLPMRQILTRHEFARKASKVEALSATTTDWLQTVPGALTDFGAVGARASRPLSPGWLRVTLALAAIVLVVGKRRHRRSVVFVAILGCWALVLSLGMNLRMGGWHPWLSLVAWIPGFSQVRSAYRFAFFAQMAVVLLAAIGLDRLSRLRAMRAKDRRFRWLLRGIVAVACLLAAFEVRPLPARLAVVPDVSDEPAWVAFVRDNTPEGRAIVCLPFAHDYSARGSEPTGRWMLYATRHGVPMVNGYSGFFPNSWSRMVKKLQVEPFSESTLGMLVDAGVEYMVIDPEFMEDREYPEEELGPYRLRRTFRDPSGVEVWRLVY